MRIQDEKINDFLIELGSNEPVPGGGSAAALVGAIGVSLGKMVAELTLGKEKYFDVQDEMNEIIVEASELKDDLLDSIDEDAHAFAPLAKAYGVPKNEPGRDELLETALNVACMAPINLMKKTCKALELMDKVAMKGNALAISDAGVGASCCKAALKGASLNVFINTKMMKNREHAVALEKVADEMLKEYCPMAEEIYEKVVGRIR